jgi:desampylase
MRTLHMGPDLLEAIRDAARRAFPHECCGLVEGVVTPDGWRALAVHKTKNLAGDPARHFLIDPEIQFRLLRGLRGTERAIIGCFHSHPDGAPQPSERDREGATDDGFVWLVAGGAPEAFEVKAYVFDAAQNAFGPLAIAVA